MSPTAEKELPPGARPAGPSAFDRRLAGLLAKRGLCSREDLAAAGDAAQRDRQPLSAALVDGKFIAERDLVGAIAQEMGLAPVDLERLHPSEAALESLPQDLSTYYGVLPLARLGNILTLAVANPFDILKLDDLQLVTGCDIRPVVATESAIARATQHAYNPGAEQVQELVDDFGNKAVELTKSVEEQDEDLDLSELTKDDSAHPVVKFVNLIIYQAVTTNTSDIHIEPCEKRLRIRCRRDGILYETLEVPKRMQNSVTSRLKVMAQLDIAERRRPQDGKFQVKIDTRQIDFRVSILPTVHGEKVVLRILDSGNVNRRLEALGFEPEALQLIRTAIAAPYGMLLVTGPTGSGKSTTLYACLREILSPEDNIITVEDPVEYQIEGVNQVAVNVKQGLTFAAALRSILRQDPDIIMVGEIRDTETAEIAIKAALTGHLVLSTLHTNDAPSTVTRLIDMSIDPFMVASSVLLVAAQRLARKLCPECREPTKPPPERLVDVGCTPDEAANATVYRAKGCTRCTGGYRGRFGMLEVMPLSEEIKRLIIGGGSAIDIRAAALREGMISLRRCGLRNALKGVTSVEEVLAHTTADEK
jgi:type IV pilus assembly protein PilB